MGTSRTTIDREGTGAASQAPALPSVHDQSVGSPVADWQSGILGPMYRLGGLAIASAALITTAIVAELRVSLALILACGLAALSLARWAERHRRIAAAVYSWLLLAAIGFVAVLWGWPPALVVALSYTVVVVSVLHGRWATVTLLAFAAAFFALGGLLVHLGLLRVPFAADIDPRFQRSWVLSGCLYLVLTGLSTRIVRGVVRVIVQSEEKAEESLVELEYRLDELGNARIERIAHEKELRDAQKLQAVAQLGNGFGHVFNNVLTVVRCACEEARGDESEAQQRRSASAIAAVTTSCSARTRELLLLSRPHDVDRKAVQLEQAVEEIRESIRDRLRDNVHVEFRLAPSCCVSIAPSWLEQIIVNLLLNAEQAMPGGGEVRIETAAVEFESTAETPLGSFGPGNSAVLRIVDNGHGMTDEVLRRACEPFFTTRGQEKHDGLGLTLVHSMVRHAGGLLALSSSGEGTSVTLYLPDAASDASRESATAASLAKRGDAEELPSPTQKAPPRPQATLDDRPRPSSSDDAESTSQRKNRRSPALSQEPTAAAPNPRALPSADAPTSAAPLPVPNAARHDDWREQTLHSLLLASACIAAVMGIAIVGLTDAETRSETLPLMVTSTALLLLAYWRRTMAPGLRIGILLFCYAAPGGYYVVQNGLLSPAPVALLSSGVLLAALFGDARVQVVAVLGTTLFFLAGAIVWGAGVVQPVPSNFAPDVPRNWIRIGIVLPAVLSIVGVTANHLMAVTAQKTRVLVAAYRRLEEARRRHIEEAEALERLADVRTRAARMEATGRLIGMVAHDLNNSLMGMMGWAELLAEAQTPEERIEAIAAVEQAADYAEALVDQLQHGANASHTGASLDLGRALSRMSSMLGAVLGHRRGGSLRLDLALQAECFVAIQEHSLRRLVLNLVANARDAMDRPGTCRVTLDSDGKLVTLGVEDEGSGMTDVVRDRLFEAFFTTKEGTGTGLGLHAVAQIVSATSGQVELWSELGRGTRVSVRWPAAAPSSLVPHRTRSTRPLDCKGEVLLAEDDALVRGILARGLRSDGYSVVEAKDGNEAASLIDAGAHIDALCVDAIMPGIPSVALVPRFQERHPGGAVLIMSGYLPDGYSFELLHRRGITYLRKPFSHSRLASMLATAMLDSKEET